MGSEMCIRDRVYDQLGRCDLVINNAAVAAPLPALRDSTKRWRTGVDVNLNGPFYLMYHFCPRMPEGAGRVINISSGAAVTPDFGRPNYTATKLALEGLSQSLAHELSGKVALTVLRVDVAVGARALPRRFPMIVARLRKGRQSAAVMRPYSSAVVCPPFLSEIS